MTHGKLVLVNGLPDQAVVKQPNGKPTVELFRLDRDPSEKTNLVTKEPEQAAKMLADLREHYRLKIAGIPDYQAGRNDFTAPKDWVISED